MLFSMFIIHCLKSFGKSLILLVILIVFALHIICIIYLCVNILVELYNLTNYINKLEYLIPISIGPIFDSM